MKGLKRMQDDILWFIEYCSVDDEIKVVKINAKSKKEAIKLFSQAYGALTIKSISCV